MRFVMISMVIIVFCWSTSIINTVGSEFEATHNRSLYGHNVTTQLKNNALSGLTSKGDFNSTVQELMETSSNPPQSPLDTMWGWWTGFTKAISTIKSVLVDPIFNIANILMYPIGKDVLIVPSYLAYTIQYGAWLTLLLGLAQLMGRLNLRGGL